jgi:outer membrane protein OmpA-like peptidoglycan-associated protein/tetratricopeptide (TPR) repeat protein
VKRFITICIITLTALFTQAQSTNIKGVFQSNFKKAEELYSHLAYRNALELYLAVVQKDSSNHAARQRAADCYFRLGNTKEAERWYAALVKIRDTPAIYQYQYAQVLAIQGKYSEAQHWFSEYAKVSGDARAKSKFEFIEHISYYYRDSLLYYVRNEPFNSDQSDFAPQYYGDGLVFVSARDRDLFIKHQSSSALNDKESMLNIFYAPKNSSEERDAVLFHNKDLNSNFHDGPIAFFSGGRKAAFSRNNLVAGKPVQHSGRVNLKLYFGELDATNTMTNIDGFAFNDNSYSVGHPWVSESGDVLYFASNKPGGQGGVDLYKSEKNNGRWQEPANLGSVINTMGDEFYPFMANDSTLYFSSTGLGGLGGLDIYVTHKTRSGWSNPENVGYPLNTSGDDFALVLDAGGRKGVFSSNRAGGVGYDDIYSFEVKSFFVIGKVVEQNQPGKLVSNARITILDEKGHPIDTMSTNERGHFLADLPFDQSFLFTASKNGYATIDTFAYSTRTRTLGHDSVTLSLWKNSLFARGVIYSNESQSKMADVTVTLKNVTDGTVDSIHTSQAGNYNFTLKSNKKYVISATRYGFIPHEFALNTTGIKSGDLLNDILLEEVFLEKVVVQFDFEKWDIKSSFHRGLDEVARVMKKGVKYHLHIGAYADSQGTHEFNMDLSNKRATAVVKYLVDHGVNKARITAVGFGEQLLLNQCSNGVDCSDEEHAKNRRAELKVQLISSVPSLKR